MPNLAKQIPETMRKQGISDDVMAQFNFPKSNEPEEIMSLVKQMGRFLLKEQLLAVMQEQGCCKTGIGPKAHREFGQENKDKPLVEKITLINKAKMPHKAPCHLNDDGTLSVYWGSEDLSKKSCPCGFTKKLPDTYEVPLTFCGCCGGHIRNNYQKSLGVNLKLKEIVSSSSNSKGKKRCEFQFEILS